MNHSIYSADRTTHLKIVVVALVAGIVVAGLGISAARNNSNEGLTQTARVMKAGKPVMVTTTNNSLVR
jgi:ABC-type proline/glycine betaine transport system permease subunit